jgi:hypothetical protein
MRFLPYMFEQLPKKFIFRAMADYSFNPDCCYGLGGHSFITLGTIQALDTLVLAWVCRIGTHNKIF